MNAIWEIPSHHAVAAFLVHIHFRGTSRDDFQPFRIDVVKSFKELLPVVVFENLIEYYHLIRLGERRQSVSVDNGFLP